MTPASEPTAAAIVMSHATARTFAIIATRALLSGRMGLSKAERAVEALDAAGEFELGSQLRNALFTRRALLKSRGFASAGAR